MARIHPGQSTVCGSTCRHDGSTLGCQREPGHLRPHRHYDPSSGTEVSWWDMLEADLPEG